MPSIPAERRANQAILFGYLIEEVLPRLKRNGVWSAISVAPLTAAEVTESFEAVIAHDNYKRQTLITETEDGYRVRVENGQIKKERA